MLSKQTAYENWPRIKDQRQPPTLHRLPGVAESESDADVISNAADSRRQTKKANSFIWRAIAAAFVLLLGTAAMAQTSIPIPDASSQAEAAKLGKEVYGSEWSAAKTSDQKQTLAKKLLEKAMESQKDRSAQFVLLRLAKEIAEQASDCQTAFEAIEETDRVFQIDATEMKADALKKCASTATKTEQHRSVAEKAVDVADQTLGKDNFTLAKSMIDLAHSEARKAKDETLIKQSSERKVEVEKNGHAFEAARTAMATLEKTPTDPEANLVLGKYKCFSKGDWEGGLPKLAIGSDPTLKTLAEAELKGASSADDQAKLGDAWWSAAESQKGIEKKQFQARAEHWYRQAQPGLVGLQRVKADRRIAEAQEAEAIVSSPASSKAKWVPLFRSLDPAIWNTDSRGKDRFAIPLAKAPTNIRFLKMQLSPKEIVIIPMTDAKLGGLDNHEKFAWQGAGALVWGGRQLGIFDRKTSRNSSGDICIGYEEGIAGLSGWGFGYREGAAQGGGNVQGSAWNGRPTGPIGTVNIEIDVTTDNLSPLEKKHLLE